MAQKHAFGIKDISLPIRVKQKSGGLQNTVASINTKVVSASGKSQNIISILTTALNNFNGDFDVQSLSGLLETIQNSLGSQQTSLEINFPYFIEKTAPISKTSGLLEYGCTFKGTVGESPSLTLCVQVPVTTLCPCSKEISQAGAHNQRAEVTLCVSLDNFIWFEDLISLIESSASCELYSLLKRPDEKYVTEKAYNNPMFVEDVVRKVAENAKKHPDINWFSAGVESFESIHKHSAYAYVDSNDLK